jgi:hypothetical protein
MAKYKFNIPGFTVELSFYAKDIYTITPLGCHAGAIGNVNMAVTPDGSGFVCMDESLIQTFIEHDLYRQIMDKLVVECKTGFQDLEGAGYPKKGHWVISAAWYAYKGKPKAEMRTPEFMDMIAQFCDNEPLKYGHYVMTEATDCGAHDNNAGFPATRTMIWHPPHVGINRDQVKSDVHNVYRPPKPVQVKPVEVKVPVPVVEAPKTTQFVQELAVLPPPAKFEPKDIKIWEELMAYAEEAKKIAAPMHIQVKLPRAEIGKRRYEQTARGPKNNLNDLRKFYGGDWNSKHGNRRYG